VSALVPNSVKGEPAQHREAPATDHATRVRPAGGRAGSERSAAAPAGRAAHERKSAIGVATGLQRVTIARPQGVKEGGQSANAVRQSGGGVK
jgi:hypothetical protein